MLNCLRCDCQGTNLPHRLTRMQKKQRELGADPKECLAAAQFISKARCSPNRFEQECLAGNTFCCFCNCLCKQSIS